jgi:hypothetical protein
MMFGGLIAAHWSWEWIFYLSGKFDQIENMKMKKFFSIIGTDMDSNLVLFRN